MRKPSPLSCGGMSILLLVLAGAIIASIAVARAQPAGSPAFRDVPAGHWAAAAVQRLSQAGILIGYPPVVSHPRAARATSATPVPADRTAPKARIRREVAFP